LSDIFLRLIKMLVVGSAGLFHPGGGIAHGRRQSVGRIFAKALELVRDRSIVSLLHRLGARQPAASRQDLGLPLPDIGSATT
jgi:hypothetical protein